MTKTFCSIDDLSNEEILRIFNDTKLIEDNYDDKTPLKTSCQGKILSNLFFNTSTRTIAILQSAFGKLGGTSLTPQLGKGSYLSSEQEEFEDILHAFEAVSDLMAIRHKNLDLDRLKHRIKIPIINSLCGTDEHSLYALGRSYSLFKRIGQKSDGPIGFYGGVNFSRPAKSLIKILNRQGKKVIIDSVISECQLEPTFISDNKINTELIMYRDLFDFADQIDALFIVEGLLQEGLQKKELNKYVETVKSIGKDDLNMLKPGILISYGMPMQISATKYTINPELKMKYANTKADLMNDWLHVSMALIMFLLNKNPANYI